MTVSFEAAQSRVLGGVVALGAERVPLDAALGRVASDAVVADIDVPSFASSAMDGFAVRRADVAARPVTLSVVDVAPAGHPARRAVGRGEAIRVLTGAVVPEGADQVIRVENTSEARSGADASAGSAGVDQPVGAAHAVEIHAVDARSNIRPPGESIARGTTLITRGTRLHAGHLGLAAGVGIDSVWVRRRPRVAIVSTGDELVPQTVAPLPPGAIYETNSITLAGLVGPDGELATVHHSEDSADPLRADLESLAADHDVIVTTGGVSMGAEYDAVRAAVDTWPVEFWRMALKPAKPMAYGRIRDAAFFGLPGNPVAAVVAFELFVRPALRILGGAPTSGHAASPRYHGLAGERIGGGGDGVVRCVAVRRDGAGRWVTTGEQGSAAVMSLAEAEALALVDADVEEVTVGDPITVVPLWSVDPASLGLCP